MSAREYINEHRVVGEEIRTGKSGQVYSVKLLQPVEPADAHVNAYKAHYARELREREYKLEMERRRVARVAAKERRDEKARLRAQFPPWYKAERELRKIGFTQERLAEVFGVTVYAVRKWRSVERKWKALK